MKTVDDSDQIEPDLDEPPVASSDPALPPVPRRRLTRDARAALAIFLVLLGVYLFTMGGHTYSVDGETYLAGTRSLFQGSTVLTPGPDLDGAVVTVENKNGDRTTAAPIGSLVLFAPGFVAGKVIAAPFAVEHREEIVRLVYLSANSVMTAITGSLLFLLCRRLGARRSSAVLLALTFGLGTWAWAHAQTDFSEPGTAMALTAALLAAVRWWERPSSRRAAAITGFLAGFTVLTRPSTLLFVPILLVAGLVATGIVRRQRLLVAAAFCAGGLVAAVAMAINAWVRFGDPLDNGYPLLPYSTPIYEGVYGLLLSSGKGMLWYAPVCIVVLFATRRSFLANRRYSLTVGAILLGHASVYARFDIWTGENAYGPRYMIPLLPIVVAMLAPVIDSGRQWIRGVKVAAVFGLLIPGLLGTTMYFNAVYFNQQQGLLADIGVIEATQTQQHLAWNFYPRTSPLMLHVRSVPDLVRNTVDRLQGEPGGITPLPAPYEDRIHWYARAVELDVWWAWWSTKDGPGAIYLLLVVPLAALALGIALARRSWRTERDDAVATTTPPGIASGAGT